MRANDGSIRYRESERGAALLVSLAMLLVMGFIGASVISMSSMDLKTSGYDRRGTQAQFAAEAGLQEVMHRLAETPGNTITVDGETFDPAIADPASPLDPDWEVRIYNPSDGVPTSTDPSLTYTRTVQSTSDLMDYTMPGEYLSIMHKWQDRNSDGIRDANEIVLYDPSLIPPENFDTGTPVEVIQVAGRFQESQRTLSIEATRYPFSPNVLAAISSDAGVDVTGNAHICGQNHDMNTPVGTHLESTPACSPNYDMPSGHLPAVTTSGDPVATGGSSDLLGFPTVTDTSSSNPFYSLAEALGVTQDVVDEMLTNADQTSANDGSPYNGVTYVNGDATGGEKFNGGTGNGLLYVNGDLDVSGNFTWTGLIYVEGDFTVTGGPWILGSVMVRGSSNYAFSGGNPGILYSRDAIRQALASSFNFVVLSWKEL